jgi:hypothetical protein
VAAGILPAVEPGFQPGGPGTRNRNEVEMIHTLQLAQRFIPDGKMPSSTAARMAAATLCDFRRAFSRK